MTISPPEPDPTLDDPETDDPDEGPEDEPEHGFAVYDLTLRRFVGRVHKSKSAASKASSKVKGHEYETRKV